MSFNIIKLSYWHKKIAGQALYLKYGQKYTALVICVIVSVWAVSQFLSVGGPKHLLNYKVESPKSILNVDLNWSSDWEPIYETFRRLFMYLALPS